MKPLFNTLRTLSITIALALLPAACSEPSNTNAKSPDDNAKQGISLDFRIIASFSHRKTAFTQGFIIDNEFIYESTGRYGQSTVAKLTLGKQKPLLETELSNDYFGEGLAKVGKELVQLTWKSGKVFRYDINDLKPTRQQNIEGEGWGLTYDGENIINSNGTATLYFRDPENLAVIREIKTTFLGRPVRKLNELEMVEGYIAANVFQTSDIIFINPNDGRVIAKLDLRQLLAREKSTGPVDVLNGIAYDPNKQSLYVTGKLWNKIYELKLADLPPLT